ncbi:hypothetical protein ACLOJK_033018 [Asimina triloba]
MALGDRSKRGGKGREGKDHACMGGEKVAVKEEEKTKCKDAGETRELASVGSICKDISIAAVLEDDCRGRRIRLDQIPAQEEISIYRIVGQNLGRGKGFLLSFLDADVFALITALRQLHHVSSLKFITV